MSNTQESFSDGMDPDLAVDILAAWRDDAGLRAEFGGDLGRYAAFREADANGQVKILGRKGAQSV